MSNNTNNKNIPPTLEDPIKYFIVRDWNEFFNFDRFGLPKAYSKDSRIQNNLHYYRANYLALFCFVAYFNIVFYPSLYLISVIYFMVGIYNFKTRPIQGLKPIGTVILYLLISVIPLYKVYSWRSILSIVLTFFFISCHVAFRKRTIKNKATNIINNVVTNLFTQKPSEINKSNK